MDRLEIILENAKKIITDKELQQIFRETDYQLFHSEVERLVEAGILVPVKSSKDNGRRPPLFNKYRIIKPQEDNTGYLEAIRRLNPVLNISSYLQRPELYKKHLEIVEGISKYLWYSKALLEKSMSRKERSFSVWGREKLLDEHLALVKEVLKFNGLEERFLNYYDTPEPFFEYLHQRGEFMTVLVIENKDTWFTFRKLMQDTGKNRIAGTVVDVLLYGEGNKITKRGALEEYSTTMLGGQGNQAGHTVRFLYFGDLDWEGIRMFFRTRKANPSLEIKPFSSLYRLMLELAETVELPKSLDQRGVIATLPEFFALLDLADENDNALIDLLAEGTYIPQEIVNYQVAATILK
ncbi:MAG: Wadjet anti-phage system protein JetD domain-containing protein [Desulfitobacteriaceae bacterium]